MPAATTVRERALPANFTCFQRRIVAESLWETVRRGLSGTPKRLPPWLLYDATGARLFELICQAPDYYVPRVESAIIESRRAEIARLLSGRTVIEYGAGDMRKMRRMMELATPHRYLAIDVAGDQLVRQGLMLARDFPSVVVEVIHADYGELSLHPWLYNDPAPRAFFFPGSSIGNFEPGQAERFLADGAQLVGHRGVALIGVDLVKSTERLERAYNDRRGYTAAFNLNVLSRINRELHGNFHVDAFRHHAFYNKDERRVEMHLVSRIAQTVTINGEPFDFLAGESIHTENSYKYTPEAVREMGLAAGFTEVEPWTDPAGDFGLFVLR